MATHAHPRAHRARPPLHRATRAPVPLRHVRPPSPAPRTTNNNSFVWLAPIYATATLPAASSFELVVQATENPVREYFAMNARGEYCYLVPRTDGGVKVYDLALYRTTVPCTDGNSPLGFDGCSVDLETEPWLDGYVEEVDSDVEEEEEGEYEYLYLVWRTHPV